MTNILLSKPTLTGLMRESPRFRGLSSGTTDTLLLIGHADANVMYEPYQVNDIKQAVNFLKADIHSPLLRGLLEAYNGGCKDIWLYAAAPMSEYADTIYDRYHTNVLSDRFATTAYAYQFPSLFTFPGDSQYPIEGLNFYQRWYERLTDAYAALSDWDFAEIVVPLEAVFYDSGDVDFATQLVDFCSDRFSTTGAVILGVLGTRMNNPTSEAIAQMCADTRVAALDSAERIEAGRAYSGKFVIVAVGEGIIQHPQVSIAYAGSLAVQVATNLAIVNLSRSIAGIKLPNTSSLIGPNYTNAQLSLMTQAKLNPVVRSTRAKRGAAFETKLLTDNTLGSDGSDFWAMTQMHIVANCINQIRSYGNMFIGKSQNEKFKETIDAHLRKLVQNEYIRDYSLNISPLNLRSSRLDINVGIRPIFGVRNIFFSVNVGLGG